MNLFLIGIDKNNLTEFTEEIRYSNIASLIVSFAAFIIFLVLLKVYGWVISVYIALGMVAFINLTLLLNYAGFTLSSRVFLSILPPFIILVGNMLTLIIIPDTTHSFSFDVRVLILAVVVLPMLLFSMSEWVYLIIGLVLNAIILFLFDYIHTLFNVQMTNAYGTQYYISTIFYVIAYFFIITTVLIFKIRGCKLKRINKKINLNLEKKVAERTLELGEQSNELIKHNNELEQFSFTVSHNLRGPIARLLGLTTLFSKLHETEQPAVIKQVHAEAKSLDDVIKDLNNILQVRNNLYKIKEYLNISEEIRRAQKLLSIEDQKECCSDNLELNIGVPWVFGVREYLQSILNNLMGNAIKYKKEGIDLKVKISTEVKGSNVLLKIEDNGIGIDLDKFKDKVFKMYSRFDLKTQGKGLGLYLVKQQVESMNGSIQIKSVVNQGTTFSILLPIPDSSQVEHQVYFENNIVSFVYNVVLQSTMIYWKRKPSSEEYRDIFSRNIKNLPKYSTNFWLHDTSNFGTLSTEDQKWFNNKIIPLLLNSGIKGIIMINNKGEGFKSLQWDLFKNICSVKGIVLAFKFSLEEANAFILSLQKKDTMKKL